jgi:transcriptional regulator with XRE-family HTH domain
MASPKTKGTLRDRIALRRAELKLSQAEAAERAGMKQSQWSKAESGYAVPDIDTLIRIAEALDATLDYLLGLAKYPDSSYAQNTIERHMLLDFRKGVEDLRVTILNEEITKLSKPIRNSVLRLISIFKSGSEVDSDLDKS